VWVWKKKHERSSWIQYLSKKSHQNPLGSFKALSTYRVTAESDFALYYVIWKYGCCSFTSKRKVPYTQDLESHWIYFSSSVLHCHRAPCGRHPRLPRWPWEALGEQEQQGHPHVLERHQQLANILVRRSPPGRLNQGVRVVILRLLPICILRIFSTVYCLFYVLSSAY
jgi:hypothetical protein